MINTKKRNMTRVSESKLREWKACSTGLHRWLYSHDQHNGNVAEFIQLCIDNKDESKSFELSDAEWLIVRCLSKKNMQRYAVYAAEQVLPIFEAKHPKDNRPRLAIKAAKNVIKRDTDKNRKAAAAAADEAARAADAAYDAYDAASAAADAAYWAARAARAARAAEAAGAARAAELEMRIKILNFGLEMLEAE